MARRTGRCGSRCSSCCWWCSRPPSLGWRDGGGRAVAEPRARSRLGRNAAMLALTFAVGPLLVAGTVAINATSAAATSGLTGSSCDYVPPPSPVPSPSTTSGGRTASPTPSPSPPPTPCVGFAAAPFSGLADGQYLKVNFISLQPFEAMNFRQCIAYPVNVSTDCAPVNPRVIGFADGSGGGSTFLPVYAYANDKLKNANGIPIPCDAEHICSIMANTSYHHTYVVQISFARS